MNNGDNADDGLRQPLTVKEYDVVYKVLVVGESSVGKTAVVQRYTNPNQVLPTLLPTIGIDYRLVDLVIDGLRVRVQLWDTVGQERYRTMTKNFFRGAKGILLLFDVTNRESFVLVENWITSLKSYDLDKEELFMIGNKIDLAGYREVSYDEGKTFANGFGMKYFETSAKTGENVKEVIDQLIFNMKDANNPFQDGSIPTPQGGNKWEELFRENDEDTIRLGSNAAKKRQCCW